MAPFFAAPKTTHSFRAVDEANNNDNIIKNTIENKTTNAEPDDKDKDESLQSRIVNRQVKFIIQNFSTRWHMFISQLILCFSNPSQCRSL